MSTDEIETERSAAEAALDDARVLWDIERKHGKLLNELYQRREEADYAPTTTDVDVEDVFGDAEAFVEAVRRFLGCH